MKLDKYFLLLMCFVFLLFVQITEKTLAQDENVNVISNNQNKNINNSNSSNKLSNLNQNVLEQVDNSNQDKSNFNVSLDKEKSDKKMELSYKELGSVKLEGFEPWVYYVLFTLFIIFVIASFYFVPKTVAENSKLGTFAILIIFAGLMFFVGKACDRRSTSFESNQKIETVKEKVENNLPPLPPFAPSGLSSAPLSDSQIKLSWDDNDNNENGFELERRIGSEGKFVLLGKVGPNATTYTDSELGAETTASYQVRAFKVQNNSKLFSEFSNASTGTTTKANKQDNWANPSNVFYYLFLYFVYPFTFFYVFIKYWSISRGRNQKYEVERNEERLLNEIAKLKTDLINESKRRRSKSSRI
jgi:hypothetical protein